eukprot:scaffold6880_cov110-Isochrysis_galbana.AAC.26
MCPWPGCAFLALALFPAADAMPQKGKQPWYDALHVPGRGRPCRLCRPRRPYGPAICPTAATWSCPAWSCSTCSSRKTLARPSAPRARWRPSAGCAARACRPGGPPDAHAPRVRLGAAAPAGTVAARHRRRAIAELATARVARKPLAARCPVAGRRRARAAAAGRCLLAPRTARSRPVFFSFFFIMLCPGRHRAVPTTGSGGPCAGPQVPVQTLWPNLGLG